MKKKMSKEIKEVIIGLLISVFFCVIISLVLINLAKEANKKRYSELPKINIVEEEVENYLVSKEPFDYIKFEIMEEDILCYYFEKDGNYFKAIYRFKGNNFLGYKYWVFDKIVIAFEAEVEEDEEEQHFKNYFAFINYCYRNKIYSVFIRKNRKHNY